MEKKGKRRLEIIALVFGIAVILTAVVGLTYSFFSATISGGPATSTNVKTGVLDIEFLTSDYINNSDVQLIPVANFFDEADKCLFSVKNTLGVATVPSKYAVYMTGLDISTSFKTADLIWELKKNGTTAASGNFAANTSTPFNSAILAEDSEILLIDNMVLPLGTTDNWILYVGILETSNDQSDLYNGHIEFKLKIVAVP